MNPRGTGWVPDFPNVKDYSLTNNKIQLLTHQLKTEEETQDHKLLRQRISKFLTQLQEMKASPSTAPPANPEPQKNPEEIKALVERLMMESFPEITFLPIKINRVFELGMSNPEILIAKQYLKKIYTPNLIKIEDTSQVFDQTTKSLIEFFQEYKNIEVHGKIDAITMKALKNDAEKSDAEKSDAEKSDAEKSDAEKSDAKARVSSQDLQNDNSLELDDQEIPVPIVDIFFRIIFRNLKKIILVRDSSLDDQLAKAESLIQPVDWSAFQEFKSLYEYFKEGNKKPSTDTIAARYLHQKIKENIITLEDQLQFLKLPKDEPITPIDVKVEVDRLFDEVDYGGKDILDYFYKKIYGFLENYPLIRWDNVAVEKLIVLSIASAVQGKMNTLIYPVAKVVFKIIMPLAQYSNLENAVGQGLLVFDRLIEKHLSPHSDYLGIVIDGSRDNTDTETSDSKSLQVDKDEEYLTSIASDAFQAILEINKKLQEQLSSTGSGQSNPPPIYKILEILVDRYKRIWDSTHEIQFTQVPQTNLDNISFDTQNAIILSKNDKSDQYTLSPWQGDSSSSTDSITDKRRRIINLNIVNIDDSSTITLNKKEITINTQIDSFQEAIKILSDHYKIYFSEPKEDRNPKVYPSESKEYIILEAIREFIWTSYLPKDSGKPGVEKTLLEAFPGERNPQILSQSDLQIPMTWDIRQLFEPSPQEHDALAGSSDVESALKSVYLSLPEVVDLSFWCSAIEDQGSLNSCTAHAGVALNEYFAKKAFNKYTDVSPLFLYKAARNLMQRYGDTGASVRETMKAMVLFGIPPEKHWPYDEEKYDEEPTSFCYSFAQNYQALKYFRLDYAGIPLDTLLIQIKSVLVAEFPCMFGFTLYASSYDEANVKKGYFPYPGRNDKMIGGHAIVAVGYDDHRIIENSEGRRSEGAILIRNSWGTEWGAGGYGWLPYDYILAGLTADWWSLLKSEWFDSGHFSATLSRSGLWTSQMGEGSIGDDGGIL